MTSERLLPLLSGATAAMLGLISGCEKPSPASDATPAPPKPILPVFFEKKTPVPLPVDRTITDATGRTLEATIVARSDASLFVVRKSDGLKTEVPLANLSEADRNFASGLELKAPPPNFLQPVKKKDTPAKSAYIKSREDEIARLTNENKRLTTEVETSTNSMLAKSRLSTIRRNEVEIDKLRAAIQIYRLDNADE